MQAIAEYTRKGDLRLSLMKTTQSVHLVGIGGIGMSALARLYLDAGWSVTGSDAVEGEVVQRLRERGVVISSEGVPEDVALVVRSPAIPASHADLTTANQRGSIVQNRTEALTTLLAGREVISVAGSHGKSTTSTMLTMILAAYMPGTGHMVGGVLDALGKCNARLGEGPMLVAETCEAFRGLHLWQPSHCLVTNVDDEHSDHYGGIASLQAAFAALVDRVPDDGAIILCGDDLVLAGIAARLGDRTLTYGIGEENRVYPAEVRLGADESAFALMVDGVQLGHVTLPVPGLHNLRNALGALAMAVAIGVDPDLACATLGTFRPVHRRWQKVGAAQGVRVFDDFAHHPTEIEATLSLARSVAGGNAVHAVVQPQLISRTLRMAEDYAVALALADRVWRLPLDPAGEAGDPTLAEHALDEALGLFPRPWIKVEDADACAAAVGAHVRPGDVVVCMGPALARQSAARVARWLAEQPLTQPSATQSEQAPNMRGPLLCDRFDAQVAAQPEAICAINETDSWTYAQLDAEARRIAAALWARRIGPGDLVVVTMRKTLSFVATLIGISKAGAAFVPIDPRMSRSGMGHALRRAGARLTITDDPWRAMQAGFDAPITLAELLLTPTTIDRPQPQVGNDDLAYAIFTSGSTGMPRLVGVEHRQVASFFDQTLDKVFLLDDYRLVPCSASISFDAIVNQVFCTLFHGGTLLLVDDIGTLARSVHFRQITLLGMPPSNLRLLLDMVELPPSLKTLILGGEPTPPELLDRLRQVPTLRRVCNLYGPAETTLAVFAGSLLDLPVDETGPDRRGQVLGQPFEAIMIRIVDEAGYPVAAGEDGVLLIGGPTVGRGYLGAAALTAERFLPDPDHPGLRWYRTGDIVHQRPDGSYLFIGREDDQVKINGARIELGEVRAALLSCSGVTDAAALALTGFEGRKSLLGYVVLEKGTDIAFLRTWMRQNHAAILHPHRLIALAALPLQINGKLDRRALLDLAATSDPARPSETNLGEIDAKVLEIWRSVLKQADLSFEDDFRAAGGDSLMAMEVLMAVEAEFGLPLAEITMDTLTTPAAMARAMELAPQEFVPPISDVLHRQRMYLAGWSGQSAGPDALIRTLTATLGAEAGQGLFWVFQGDAEFTALHASLKGSRMLHGMRSGHKLFEYTPDTIDLLAEAYAEEICSLQPEGPVAIGGNCQGAIIARATAFALRRRRREVSHLLLMEFSKFWKYDEPVHLIFGGDSVLNPFQSGEDPTAGLNEAFPAGFRTHFITGAHGQFFQMENLSSLATALTEILWKP